MRDAGPRAELGVPEERRESLCSAPYVTRLLLTRKITAINHVKNWMRAENQSQLVGPVTVVVGRWGESMCVYPQKSISCCVIKEEIKKNLVCRWKIVSREVKQRQADEKMKGCKQLVRKYFSECQMCVKHDYKRKHHTAQWLSLFFKS